MSHINKRPREDELEKLDDSMASLVNDFSAKPNKSINDLCEFVGSYIKKSEDFRRTMYEVHYQHNDLQERVTKVEDKVKANSGKSEENSDRLELVEREMEKMKEKALENEETLHKLDQREVDKDIYISGFPAQPNEEEVTAALMKLHNIPMNKVDRHYSFSFTVKPRAASTPMDGRGKRRTVYQMVIGFKDLETKMKFMKNKKDKGPIALEQLTTAKLKQEDAKITIRCVNRLSKFNLKVQRHLMTSKVNGNIVGFQLHNGLFRLKETDDSNWKIIGTEEALDPYNEEEKKKKQQLQTSNMDTP
jgi:hypothetical protein